MQLVNGSSSVWICGVGQSIWDIFVYYSQKIFDAQWVTFLQHGWLSSGLIGQNGFLGPRRLPRGQKFNTFQYPLLQRYVNKMRNVAWKSSASITQNLTSNFSSFRFERLLPELQYNAMQIRYRDNLWRLENYSNQYEAFLTFVA